MKNMEPIKSMRDPKTKIKNKQGRESKIHIFYPYTKNSTKQNNQLLY